MKISRILAALLVLSLMAPQGAFAGAPAPATEYKGEGILIGGGEFADVTGIRIGKATLKTGFSTQGQFDSNVYLASNNPKRDYIFTLRPKILMDLPFGQGARHILQMMYVGEGGIFCDQTKQNYYNQNAAANLNLKLPFGYFNVNDDFRDTRDRAGTEFTTQVHRLENRVGTTIGIEKNKFTFETGYANFFKRYYQKQYEGLDYFENTFRGTVYYQMFPKTKALIDYAFGLLDYYNDRQRNGHFNQVVGGVKGELTGKTVGVAKAGFQERGYDSGDGYTGFVGELGLITQFSEKTEVSLNYFTTPVESTSSSGNYYTGNTVRAQLDQKLFGNFSALVRSEISRDIYPQTDLGASIKRRDWIFGEGVWLYYHIKKWGKVGIGYDYRRRGSNIDSESYTDHLVSTRLDLTY